jgi:hypothetical protein
VFQEMTAQRTEVRRLIAKKPEQEIEYQWQCLSASAFV